MSSHILGSLWERDGIRYIVVSATDDGVVVRRLVNGSVKGPRTTTTLDGYTRMPEWDSPTLRCVDRTAARAAVAFLYGIGLTDAFADGCTVVAPLAAPIVASNLRHAAREKGWVGR